MIKLRFWFYKRDRLKYISHLDINRTMTRVIKLSGLPVHYSNGFNPRPAVSFALPLSLGIASECEVMDVTCDCDAVPADAVERLNAQLPPLMRVFRAAEAVNDPKLITDAQYEITFTAPGAAEAFAAYWSADALPVTKKTKSSEQTVDLKSVCVLTGKQTTADGVTASLRMPAGSSFSVNPQLLCEDFRQKSGLDAQVEIQRTAMLLADGADFC